LHIYAFKKTKGVRVSLPPSSGVAMVTAGTETKLCHP